MSLYDEALKILRLAYGERADFRKGQYEAIEAAVNRKRTLIVQRTGWGKSIVYFISAKLFRQKKMGCTIVVSPLLVLMDNQMEMARKMGLNCGIINSTTKDTWPEIIASLKNDELDVVFVTPESLFRDEISTMLPKIHVGLFVIDEAHCISDWGHDFRLEYGKLGRVISALPANVSVLAVTATANNRVIDDLKRQLGNNVYVSRGELSRESLHIQILFLETKAKRYGWLLENLEKLPGTGIIYCLTRKDCEELSDFLSKNGLSVMPYYSGNDEFNDEAIQKFHDNEIKAVAATVKLGMGYDKGDISFVIHYQTPGNIVSYYQQTGRAGRNIPDAYAFLMTGGWEDERINRFFIDTAFPLKHESESVYGFIAGHDGAKLQEIEKEANIKRSRVAKALAFLENDGLIYRENNTYYASPKKFYYDSQHYREVTRIREREMRQMKKFTGTEECYARFILGCLESPEEEDCGKCANCLGGDIYPGLSLSEESVKKALLYIKARTYKITPRRKWPDNKNIKLINMEGICISRYGDSGYGEMVKDDKYNARHFCDDLVERSAEVLRPFADEHNIKHIAFIPSLRSDAVKDFAQRLAKRTGLKLADILTKTEALQQKNMNNSQHQCRNAMDSFSVKPGAKIPGILILVDDIVDSKWTLTVCGYKLMECGCTEVYPFALADSSDNE